jgi:hypothetical protein
MGNEIPLDPVNGWQMDPTNTELQLMGAACATWRMPNVNDIEFQFPCGSIMFE